MLVGLKCFWWRGAVFLKDGGRRGYLKKDWRGGGKWAVGSKAGLKNRIACEGMCWWKTWRASAGASRASTKEGRPRRSLCLCLWGFPQRAAVKIQQWTLSFMGPGARRTFFMLAGYCPFIYSYYDWVLETGWISVCHTAVVCLKMHQSPLEMPQEKLLTHGQWNKLSSICSRI